MKLLGTLPSYIGPRSLAFRVIAFSTLWAIVAFFVIFTVISTLYRQASERGFESLLSAHLFNLIGSVSVSDSGALVGSPDLGDLRFSEPNSGWYWSVEPVSTALTGQLRSASMTVSIPSPSDKDVPFTRDFQRSYRTQGISGEEIEVLESEFVLGSQNHIARFRVMGNRSELEWEIGVFESRLALYLSVFGLGMIAINAIAILFGLRPLHTVRSALAMVREGAAQRLDGKFPLEIEPLANETNALIDNNRRIVERSRTQVGNLAHSLKTPLAVMLNEGRAMGGRKGALIVEQATAMQQQIEHYLQRARVAAQRESVVYRTPVKPLLERMARVFEKLARDKQVTLVLPTDEVIFAGEREDLEEIVGNLMENAVKWSRKAIVVSLTIEASIDGVPMFSINIEDDGPGIPEEKAREALQRGRRLDETKPGTGLGLSIVGDLVKEYGGTLRLERAELGGLKVVVQLKGGH